MGCTASVPITEDIKYQMREHFKNEVRLAIEEFDIYNRGYVRLGIKELIYYKRKLCIREPEIVELLKEIIHGRFTSSIRVGYDDNICLNINIVH